MRALILQLLIDRFVHSSTNKTQISMWRPPHPSDRYCIALLIEPHREKTGFLHMRKQRRRSARVISQTRRGIFQ